RQWPPTMRTAPGAPRAGAGVLRAGLFRFMLGTRGPVLPCAPFCAMVPTMVSFFRRKKPEAAAPATDAPPPPAATTPPAPPATPDAEAPAPAAPAGAAGWRARLRGSAFARSMGGLF